MKLSAVEKEKIEALLKEMTIEEKIGQLNLEAPSIAGGFELPFEELIEMMTDGRISKEEFENIMKSGEQDFHEDDIRAGRVSGLMLTDPKKINELQKIAMEESRLGIPLLIGYDIIHGFRTVYPIALAEAGSFDTDLMERTAVMAADESRKHGVNWNFAPMVDVSRDARWGRVSEGPGEDPLLASEFAKAKVRGLQKKDGGKKYVASCLKHFAAYGACESGRDYNTTSMAESLLHNVYLAPFRAAVEEGAVSLMAAFNDLNGVPCTVNHRLLRDTLKDRYGLEGFVVSDANGIKECVTHGIAKDNADAGRQSLKAGMDMDMGTNIYKNEIAELLKQGQITEEELDDAVRRVLSVKMWLGLFDDPYVTEEEIEAGNHISDQNLALAREAAVKSMVLLKNDHNILPLKKEQRFSLVGALADMPEEVVGAWAMNWEKKDCVSIYQGLKDKHANMDYFACCSPESEINWDEAKAACEYSDIIVAVVGELVSMSGEAASKADISLPGHQRELLEYFVNKGKKVIVILMNGRPLTLSWEAENVAALVEGWQLGIQMGNAVADVLFGDANPSGRLTMSFPATVGMCPIYYNSFNTGKPGSKSKFTSRYLDAPLKALFPFGYGLSYSKFTYSDLKITEGKDHVKAEFLLTNSSDIEGTEVVQLYMRDLVAGLVRPVKELKAFTRVTLMPKESRIVSLEISKNDMGYYDNEGHYVVEDGEFELSIGGNSRDLLGETVEITFEKNE